jgi:ADP-dependent NAD(P)H-hydrate dehydratase / NAD(P)H-hydrate epimerase
VDGAWPVVEIRAAEQRLMARVPEGSLMRHAAHAVAVEACRMIGFRYGARVLLLVGPGDNGGDALFAGAELARRGVFVRAVLADPQRVHASGLAALRLAGGSIGMHQQPDLIIDGLVGIGARGPLRESLLPLAELAVSSPTPVLSVDIPSGIDPDTGVMSGPAVTADVTVCMGGLKPGLLVGAGRGHAGEIRVIDIGLGPELPPASIWQLTAADVSVLFPRPGPRDDKYTRGVVGVAAGSAEYPGAAQLAVGAARLGGVGAVRYAGHAAVAVSERWPDAIVTENVRDAGRVQCWVVGPGFGDGAEAAATLEQVLALEVPVVVDADGLNLLAKRRELLFGRRAPAVLTPHDREFARVFFEVGSDRIGAARRAADDSGAVVLLKGFATIVAEPGGRCFVNPTGAPALATAGSGDVLAGLIGSLIAAGVQPAVGAAVGAYLHGAAAGDLAGPVTATDLIEGLRATIGALQLHLDLPRATRFERL